MSELITVIEEHKEQTMSRETAVSISTEFSAFINAWSEIDTWKLFRGDSAFAYRTFYLYINLLTLPGMKNYFKRLKMNQFIKLLYVQFSSVILHINGITVAYCKFSAADLREPLDNHELFVSMLNYMNNDFESDSFSDYSTTTQSALACLWNYADKTVVIPNLIKAGYPAVVLKWLTIANNTDETSPSIDVDRLVSLESTKTKADAIRPLISITHNISRHDDGINALNSLDAISNIHKIQNSVQNSQINILCCMTLALLSTPEQIKKDRKRMNNALDQLLQSVSTASKSADYKDGGFHISEPLVVLVKLFNDDRALDYILQHAQVELDDVSTVDFFIKLLLDFNATVSGEKDPLKQLTCTVLVNILWSISFQEQYQYKRQLKNNQNLINLLEIFSNSDATAETIASSIQYVPKYIENIQTAAKGILLNVCEPTSATDTEKSQATRSLFSPKQGSVSEALLLQPIQKQNSTADDDINNSGNKPMIMISYSHDDKSLCYQLEEELKRNEKYDVWVDKNYCTTGDSWERIAHGIKQSHVILCLIKKNYTGKSVRREVIYAIDRLEKPLIPVFVLKPAVPEWLDIRTCDLTYVRFPDENALERRKVTKLMETLESLTSGLSTGSNTTPVHYEPSEPTVQAFTKETEDNHDRLKINTGPTTTSKLLGKSIDQWNKNDIKQWFEENGIMIELYNMCQFVDGSELLSFAKILLEDEKAQYKSYSEEFAKLFSGKSLLLHQFNKFSNALRKLYNEQNKQTAASSKTTIKSQTCQIL